MTVFSIRWLIINLTIFQMFFGTQFSPKILNKNKNKNKIKWVPKNLWKMAN